MAKINQLAGIAHNLAVSFVSPTNMRFLEYVKIAYKPGKSFGKYYTCNATIKANGKEYSYKILSSYS